MLGGSSLQVGSVMSGTGWMVILSLVGPVNGFEEREGIFLSTCFFPLLMAIHGNPLLGSLDVSWKHFRNN